MQVTIKPEIGRTLYYFANGCLEHGHRAGADKELSAKVVAVHSERMVNLVVWDANGGSFGVTSVRLIQPGDETPERGSGMYCQWMPWQIEQAEKQARLKAAQERVIDAVKKEAAKGGMTCETVGAKTTGATDDKPGCQESASVKPSDSAAGEKMTDDGAKCPTPQDITPGPGTEAPKSPWGIRK